MTVLTPLSAFARAKPLRPPAGLPRWQPGRTTHALHGEVFAPADEGSGAAMARA